MSARSVTRVGGPLDMLDRALLVVRRGGPAPSLRALSGGLLVAGAALLVYYVERVEGIRSLRPLLAFVLVLAWWGRALLLAPAARRACRLLWENARVDPEAGRPVDVVRTASVVGMGLWVWLWLLVGASLLGPLAIPFVLPVLALRGAVAPSWIARAGCATGGGLRAFGQAFADTSGRRATTITVELLVLLAALGLAINLFATIAVFVLLARSFVGMDVAFVESFFSIRNVFLLLVVGAVALVLLEPVRAALSALVYVDARVRQEGLDLRAAVDDALASGERRGPASGSSPGTQAAATNAAAALLVVVLFAPGLAEAQPPVTGDGSTDGPAAQLVPLERGTGPDGVAPPPDPEGGDPTGTGMPPKGPDAVRWAPAAGSGGAAPEDRRVRAQVEEILSRDEFREFEDDRGRGLSELLDRLLAWLFRDREVPQMESPSSGVSIPMPPAGLFLVLGGLLLAAVIVYVLLSRRREQRQTEAPGAVAAEKAVDPRERAPAAHLDDAAVLAQQGRFREALRALYLATLVALDRRRLIAFDPALTNWQYIRQMPRGRPRDQFSRFTRLFDYKWYGDELTTEEDYRSCRTLADRIVSEQRAEMEAQP